MQKPKDKSAGDVEGMESGEQQQRRFRERMTSWERQPTK